MPTLNYIALRLARSGPRQYSGELVTQRAHALQTAPGETPSLRGIDDAHPHVALPLLRELIPDAVRDAVTPHVGAKRFRCRVNAGYFARLSAAPNTTHA